MRLTLALLGWTWDWSLEPTTPEAEAHSLDGGLLASTPVGFTAAYPVPEEVPLPQRVPPWDDEE